MKRDKGRPRRGSSPAPQETPVAPYRAPSFQQVPLSTFQGLPPFLVVPPTTYHKPPSTSQTLPMEHTAAHQDDFN